MNRRTLWAWMSVAVSLGLLPGSLAAQTSGDRAGASSLVVRTERTPSPLKIEHIVDELPNSQIVDIARGPEGFMWIATPEGIARFDGYDVRNYQPASPDGFTIGSKFVKAVTVANDRLWVATGDAGLHVYDSDARRFEEVTPKEGSIPSALTALRSNGEVLVMLAGGGGSYIFDPAKETSDLLGEEDIIYSTVALNEEEIWLGTSDEGAFQYDISGELKKQLYGEEEGLSSDNVTAIELGANGTIWIGTDDGGLNRLGGDDDVQQFLADPTDPTSISWNRVTSILETGSGEIWVGTKNGLNRLEQDGESFETFFNTPRDPTSLPFDWVTVVTEASGDIFVGTYSRGIGRFDHLRRAFDYYRTSGTALAFAEEKGGSFWMSVFNEGLAFVDAETGESTYYEQLEDTDTGDPINLKSMWISAITRHPQGYLILPTYGYGLIVFDPAAGWAQHFSTESSDIPSNNLLDMAVAQNGEYWFATLDMGIVRASIENGEISFSSILPREHLGGSSDHLFTLRFDRNDPETVWVGSADGGLQKVSIGSERVESFTHSDDDPGSIADDAVLSIAQDRDGILWLGTHNGLVRFDPETSKATNYPTTKFGSDTVYGVLIDADGHVWLSTNGAALLRFDPDEETFEKFSQHDGIQGKEFAQGGYYLGEHTGRLFVGGIAGANIFDPANLSVQSEPPSIVVTDFKIANERQPLPKSVELGYDDDVVQFEFAALAFSAPEDAEYQYKLENFDDDWVTIDSRNRQATYTNLEAGDYVFKVRGSNGHGVWSEETVSIPLHVSPPPWRSWWAYSIYGFVLIGTTLAVVRYQRQRFRLIEHQNQVEALNRDLELTALVQAGFLPKEPHVADDWYEVLGYYRPAEACSGDWWYYERTRDGGLLAVVGDVTGHGPGPAMVTAAVGSTFRVQYGAATSMEERLHTINEEVLRVSDGKYQMVLTAVELRRDRSYRVYSAGGPSAMRLSKSRNRPQALPCRGTPLGTPEFFAGTLDGQLEANDRLALFTDGIPEIEVKPGRLLGLRTFSRLLQESYDSELPAATAHLVERADQAQAGRAQEDDWTVVLIDLK